MEMMNLTLLQPFIIALFLGAFLGFERSYASRIDHEEMDFIGGIRTFALVSLFGAISSFLSERFAPAILPISFFGIIALTVVSYYIFYTKHNEGGITTEVSMLICFTIGVIVEKNFLVVALFISLVTTMLLYLKKSLHRLSERIENEDIRGALIFSIITFVILLFDPDYNFYVKDIVFLGNNFLSAHPDIADVMVLNPYTVWIMVVLVSAIGFSGYIAIKILGSRKGIGLTGFLGGLASSTATTVTFSKRSNENAGSALYLSYALAVLLACSTMFPRILVEVLIINARLAPKLIVVMGLMSLAGFSYCFFLWKRSGTEKTDEVQLTSPLNIRLAIKFGIVFALIIFIARITEVLAGDSGVYVISILTGLSDVDPITLTMSQIARDDPSKLDQATIAITLAAFSNTAMKAGMALFLGSKKFRMPVLIGFVITIAAGAAGLALIYIL